MKISKKSLSLMLLIVMIVTSCICNVSATSTKITDSTIITSSNITQVFKYLKIKPLKVVIDSKSNSQKFTVKELRNIIIQQKKNNRICSTSNHQLYNVALSNSKPTTGKKKVSYLSQNSSYQIRFYVTGKYYKNKKLKYWTSIVDSEVKFKDTSITDICYNEFEETSSYTKLVNKKSNSSYILYHVNFKQNIVVKLFKFKYYIDTCKGRKDIRFHSSRYL